MDYNSFQEFFTPPVGGNNDRVITNRYVYQYNQDKNAFYIVANSMDMEKDSTISIKKIGPSGDLVLDSDTNVSISSNDEIDLTSVNSINLSSTNTLIDSITTISNTTSSTDSNNGCLVTTGGVGIGENLNVEGNITLVGSGLMNASGKNIINIPSHPQNIYNPSLDLYAINKLYADLLVPAGAVMPFVVDGPPSGWLVCDGGNYDISVYSRLYLAIGYKYGKLEGGTDFLVPDFRGMFLRGNGDSLDNELRVLKNWIDKKVVNIFDTNDWVELTNTNGIAAGDYFWVNYQGRSADGAAGGLSRDILYRVKEISGSMIKVQSFNTDPVGVAAAINLSNNITSAKFSLTFAKNFAFSSSGTNLLFKGKLEDSNLNPVTTSHKVRFHGSNLPTVQTDVVYNVNSYSYDSGTDISTIQVTTPLNVLVNWGTNTFTNSSTGKFTISIVDTGVGSFEHDSVMRHGHVKSWSNGSPAKDEGASFVLSPGSESVMDDGPSTDISIQDPDYINTNKLSFTETRPRNISVLYCIKY